MLALRSAAPVGLPLQQVGFAAPRFWVCNAPLAPCLRLLMPAVRRGDPSRRAQSRGFPPAAPLQQGRARAPRLPPRGTRGRDTWRRTAGLAFPGAGRERVPPSLLLLPSSPRACPWKRCLFWSASAKLRPLVTVTNMGPGEEGDGETDGGRGGAGGAAPPAPR